MSTNVSRLGTDPHSCFFVSQHVTNQPRLDMIIKQSQTTFDLNILELECHSFLSCLIVCSDQYILFLVSKSEGFWAHSINTVISDCSTYRYQLISRTNFVHNSRFLSSLCFKAVCESLQFINKESSHSIYSIFVIRYYSCKWFWEEVLHLQMVT